MSADELGVIGRFLFGTYWQSQLARAIAVNPRRVRYWKSGQKPISEKRAKQIAELFQRRHFARAAALDNRYRAAVASFKTPALRAWVMVGV